MSPQFRARLGLHTPNNSERTTPFNSESDSTAHGAGIQLTQYNVLYVTSIPAGRKDGAKWERPSSKVLKSLTACAAVAFF
jgi:hypothetical protein